MGEHRQTWVCSKCTSSGEPISTGRTFQDQRTLQDHLRKAHKLDATQPELSIASRYSRRETPLSFCLICGSHSGLKPRNISEPSTISVREQNDPFFACMSNHLKTLALSSLPWQLNHDVEHKSSEAQGSERGSMTLSNEPERELRKGRPGTVADASEVPALTFASLQGGEAVTSGRSFRDTALWIDNTTAEDLDTVPEDESASSNDLRRKLEAIQLGFGPRNGKIGPDTTDQRSNTSSMALSLGSRTTLSSGSSTEMAEAAERTWSDRGKSREVDEPPLGQGSERAKDVPSGPIQDSPYVVDSMRHDVGSPVVRAKSSSLPSRARAERLILFSSKINGDPLSTSAQGPKAGPWYCMYPEHVTSVSFARKADLKRHYDVIHNPDKPPEYECDEPGCRRKGDAGFGRKDKLVEHLREVHGMDIPRRLTARTPRR